jgi:3-hydroxyacyl-CoA dehydrogenase/enoyl-CoA hydratase/3-hydroxybutyryl-CoA epimerase
MALHWSYRIDENRIATLTLDKKDAATNTLSRDVVAELPPLLREIAAEHPEGLILRSGKTSGFVAGADIKEFTTLKGPEEALELIQQGQEAFLELERLPCPTVAVIHGFALGGGLELALACRYRVASDEPRTQLGLPEVKLGIHPGFGGTVRSVRLLGVFAAMDLMLRGSNLNAQKALAVGLVDRIGPRDRLETLAREILKTRPPVHRPPFWARLADTVPGRRLLAPRLRRGLAARVRREHYPAPYAIVGLWEQYGASGTKAHYAAEAHSIAQLMCGSTARNLVRVFLLQDRLKGLGKKNTFDVRRVHVIGAGVMGGDIAAWCAVRGLEVTLQDREMRYIQPALDRAQKLFAKRLPDDAARSAAASRLRADVSGEGVSDADVVIEAIFEDLDTKKKLYREIEPRLKAGALFATNTSSLKLEKLSSDLAEPGRLVGVHFFNPVAKMPLVEVVHAAGTNPEALEKALAFTRRIDRLPIPVRSAPGFLVNRVLIPYMNEAILAVMEGLPPEAVDEAALRYGMPMGPIELADTVGLDVALSVSKVFAAEFHRVIPQKLEELVAQGHLGRKSGRGFYVYRKGKPVKNASLARLAHGDLTDRLLYPLLNESVACLREGIATDADLVDAGVIFGTGFAPFRGGPLTYVRETGAVRVHERLEELEKRFGERFRPDPGWTALLSSAS